ncbi:MAG: LytR C-terminal domain-containing protein [Candidatus Krumholzibacteriia bacterium]
MIGRRKRRPRAIILVALLAGLIGFSLAVRWLGLGARFARDEEPAFQIEVLNGTRETGIAMDVAKELRRRGIDVLIVDNAERLDFGESILVDRRGNPRLMRRLAKTIGCRMILEQVHPAPLVDATYIVGYDRIRVSAREGS